MQHRQMEFLSSNLPATRPKNYDTPAGQHRHPYVGGRCSTYPTARRLCHRPARYSAGKNIFRFNRIRTTPEITGSKAIHHIGIKNNHAYVATDFGVVVFDLAEREIRETWRNLGPAGEQQSVYQIAFKGDSIFLATDNGIQGGNLNDNLSDFSRWKI